MNQLSEKQLSFDCAMKIVNKQKWIQIKDIERLEKFIQNQQATLSALKEENEQLRNSMKELENVNLVIELRYNYGYEKYLADVRVVDDE